MTRTNALIQYGTPVEILTAYGDHMLMRALDKPVRPGKFPVVLICSEEEFERSEREGTEPDSQYWPLEDLRPLSAV